MMVKVHNLNIHPYTEVFRDRKITIPPQEFVEMDEDEADYFLQTFVFPKKDSQGRPDPLYFKKLKIERPKVEKPVDNLVCHANGQRAASTGELNQLIEGFSHMLASKDEAAESEMAKKHQALKKKNQNLEKANEKLRERIARIEEKLGFTSETTDEASV